MKKKVLALLLIVALVASLCIGLAACNKEERTVNLQAISKDNIKFGLICLHDEQSTYDANFINALKEVKATLGLRDDQVIIRTGIAEGPGCYDTAVDLVEQGCNIIMGDSFGHESYLMQAAWEYPDVRFCHATGTKAHTADYGNYYNAFASIYEGRYLAGVAAGMKLLAMYDKDSNNEITAAEATIGYVGAYPYAEVKSGYTSFYLGVKSVVSNATMKVKFTNSWYDPEAEGAAATALINAGCKLISQHADSMGAPNACDDEDIPNITYNISTKAACEDTYVIGSRINWAPYFKYVIESAINNTTIAYDYVGTLATGSVEILEVGTAAAAGTAARIDSEKAKLIAGTTKVFSTDNWTKGGQKLTEYLADVDDAGDFVPETQVIANGVFQESKFRSAPYFDIEIDGITII